jgi:uracil-DNA glycosylase family 4
LKVPVYEGGRFVENAIYREVGFRGASNAEVVVVGESPGAVEILRGKCFVGPSGKLLDEEFGKHRASRYKDWVFANAARCMLLKKEMPAKLQKQAMACCRPALHYYLKSIRPKLIICFGNVAVQQVLKISGITNKRGQFFQSSEYDCPVFVTYHPAYCMRNQNMFAYWKPDIQSVSAYINRGFTLDQDQTGYVREEVDDISFILDQTNITVGVDTETQGLEWLDRKPMVIGYSVSDDPRKGYVVRLLEEVGQTEDCDLTIMWPRVMRGKQLVSVPVRVKKVEGYIRKLRQLRDLMYRPDIKKYMINGNYDNHVLVSLGLDHEKIQSYVMDGFTAAHCLDPDVYTDMSLGDLQRIFTPHRPSMKPLADSYKEDMLSMPRKDFNDYAADDASSTLEVCQVLKKRLLEDPGKKLARYYSKFVHPITTTVLFEIERNGIMFNRARLPGATESVAKLLLDLQNEALSVAPRAVIKEHATKGLRLTRAELIRDIMFSKKGFGFKPAQDGKTATGQVSVGQNLLKRILDDLPPDYPQVEGFLNAYLRWAPFQKLHSTYLRGLGRAVRSDGRIHPQMSLTWTATGRTSSRKPNLQNIPKRNPEIAAIIRSLFEAPPGKCFIAVDYSQSELKWIAIRGRIQKFIEVFLKGEDIHVETASSVVGGRDKWNALDAAEKKYLRRQAKAINFGFVYGMHGKKFQNHARDEYNVKMTLEEAEAYRNWFLFEKYDDIPKWHDREIAFARKYGYCRSPLGRIRMLPNINSDDFMMKSEAERLAVNTPIQGPSSDSTLLGGYLARKGGVLDNKHAKIVLFVHDELVVECDTSIRDEVAQGIKDAMTHGVPAFLASEFGVDVCVPFEVDIAVGTTLSNLEEL